MIAREKFPGSPASLDALCRRYAIDNSKRKLHGALLDSEILADVYLELIGGRQPDLDLIKNNKLENEKKPNSSLEKALRERKMKNRLTQTEIESHKAFIKSINSAEKWV